MTKCVWLLYYWPFSVAILFHETKEGILFLYIPEEDWRIDPVEHDGNNWNNTKKLNHFNKACLYSEQGAF